MNVLVGVQVQREAEPTHWPGLRPHRMAERGRGSALLGHGWHLSPALHPQSPAPPQGPTPSCTTKSKAGAKGDRRAVSSTGGVDLCNPLELSFRENERNDIKGDWKWTCSRLDCMDS